MAKNYEYFKCYPGHNQISMSDSLMRGTSQYTACCRRWSRTENKPKIGDIDGSIFFRSSHTNYQPHS